MMRGRRTLFVGFVARMFGRVMGEQAAGGGNNGRGTFWMTSEISVLTPTSG